MWKKVAGGLGIGGIVAALLTTGKVADFAHDQMGFVRSSDLEAIKVESARNAAQIELLTAFLNQREEP